MRRPAWCSRRHPGPDGPVPRSGIPAEEPRAAGAIGKSGPVAQGPDSPAVDPWNLLEVIGQAAFITDADLVITRWNLAAERLYGWAAHDAIGQHAQALFKPAGLEQHGGRPILQLQRGQPWSGGLTVRHRNGSLVRVVATGTPIGNSAGELTGIVMVSAALNDAVRQLLEHANEATLALTEDGLVLFASTATERLFRWSAGDLVGNDLLALVHPEERAAALELMRTSTLAPGQSQMELRVRSGEGAWVWAQVSVSNLLHEPGVGGLVVYLHEITERRAARARLLHSQTHDPRTGLLNRAAFLAAVQAPAPAAEGSTDVDAGALLVIGVTSAGDPWPRSVADAVYQASADRLRAELTDSDVCGHPAEGEFAALVLTPSSPAAARACAERLQMQLSRPITLEAHSVTPVVTVGLTMVAGRRRAHVLLEEATLAAGQAHDGVTLFDGAHVQPRARGSAGSAGGAGGAGGAGSAGGQLVRLRRALAGGELQVHYQPVVSLADHRVTGAEALLRWQHPDRGLLSAATFVHIAEATDLINDIGAFVLQRACAQAAGWSAPDLEVAINISARQLADPQLPGVIARVLDGAGLDPARLILEITETALLSDMALARTTLRSCRDQGVRISLDDFGTGFAGYGYLRELPVDEIKIDMSFTTGLLTDPYCVAIVGGIIHVAHALGLSTTAEGIESEPQAALLTTLGCDKGQGFLWSPALPGDVTPTTAPTPPAASSTPE